MTTTIAPVPTATALHAPRTHGIAIIAAPALLLASTAAFLTAGDGINDGVLGGTISALASFAYVLGFIGVARSLESVAPRLSVAVMVLAVLGFMTGLSYSISAIDLGLTGQAFMGADPAPDGLDAIGVLAFDPWGLCVPLAYLCTAWVIWRKQAFPRWTALPLVVGAILFVPSREVDLPALPVATDVILLVALVPIGVAMFRSKGSRP